MSFFSTDGPIYGFMSRLWDMVKLNVCWLLCSLPIVTMGAATTAAFHVTMKMVDDREGYICKSFFQAFRDNLKQGSIMGCIMLIAVYAVYLDSELWRVYDSPLFFTVFVISAYVVITGFLYAFALQARYQNTVLNTLRNSFRISMRFFIRTVVLVAILVFEVLLILWNATTLFFGILVGPACIILTISGSAMYIFRQLEQEPGTVSNPEKLEEERKQ